MMAVDAQGNEAGKLFIGGLHQSTTEDSLKSYFSKFGEVEQSTVMMDNRTGRSRGFGYIKFYNNASVDYVLSLKSHVIDHKAVEPKKCNTKMKGKNRRGLKIFVGGIASEHDEPIIRAFFSNYGMVTDVNLLPSQDKLRHRGFAFVEFEDEEVVKQLISLHYLTIKGKRVEIKAMEPPSQWTSYQLPIWSTAPMHPNGRGVRGVRGNHQFTQFQQNAPWNQWTGLGTPPSWTTPNPPPPSHQQWAQHTINWSGVGNGSATITHPPGTGHAGHLSALGQTGVGWSEQSGGAANGWVPPGWGPQVAGPAGANRMQALGEDVPLYATQHQQSSQRKTRSDWDSLCYAPLNSNATPAPGDPMVGSLENWNHPANICQLTPVQLGHNGPTVAVAPDWAQTAPNHGPGSSQWVTGPNSSAGPNSMPGNPGTNGIQGGFLNEATTAQNAPQNGISMAAMAAAAFGLNTSGAPLPQWAASTVAHADPAGLKLEDPLYRPSGGYAMPSAMGHTTNNSHANLHQHATHSNGLLPGGDWRSISSHPQATGCTAPMSALFQASLPPLSQQQPQPHLYQR